MEPPPPPEEQMSAVTLTSDGPPPASAPRRTLIRSIVARPDGGLGLVGSKVTIGGMMKTGREQGKGSFAFLELNDGSYLDSLQVIVDSSVADPSILNPSGNPSLKAKISAVTRIRDELPFATHTFFRENRLRYVHTPIITTSDCEGAGEMFQVTTLFSDAEKLERELKENPPPSEDEIEAAKMLVKDKADIGASVSLLTSAKENLARLEERFKLKAGIAQKDGKIDYSHDFFGRQAFLTVSGQLQVETYACALGNVYTFGPTFRAEHSHTSRHLAEFWMIEPEIAFADLQVGELIGGTQREERYDVLVQRIQEAGLPLEPYEWYLDLRRYGTLKHSGFGLGFA
ncbi:Asparagine--tRNA ligase, cytoplasmic 1 [Acorus gramineus]|uniref:Asparagine--tRNA ligase, cytoplasmic 1 n=1 Tax=Acorus gramineus TaxID=55184 RepID=A0AAV9A2C1_ACOGR|nr:Asparagine--tRNA ligase, cytoplasmic 1 [Acorus gramineus]